MTSILLMMALIAAFVSGVLVHRNNQSKFEIIIDKMKSIFNKKTN